MKTLVTLIFVSFLNTSVFSQVTDSPIQKHIIGRWKNDESPICHTFDTEFSINHYCDSAISSSNKWTYVIKDQYVIFTPFPEQVYMKIRSISDKEMVVDYYRQKLTYAELMAGKSKTVRLKKYLRKLTLFKL